MQTNAGERDITPPRKRRRILDAEIPVEESTTSSSSSQHAITVYSWNVNGISPFLQPSVASFFKPSAGKEPSENAAKASLRDFLRRHGWPNVLFLQEVKINPEDSATIRAVEKAVRRPSSEPCDAYDYEAHFCLPSDKYNARGFGRKVYGVCSIVRKDFSETFVERLGR